MEPFNGRVRICICFRIKPIKSIFKQDFWNEAVKHQEHHLEHKQKLKPALQKFILFHDDRAEQTEKLLEHFVEVCTEMVFHSHCFSKKWQ